MAGVGGGLGGCLDGGGGTLCFTISRDPGSFPAVSQPFCIPSKSSPFAQWLEKWYISILVPFHVHDLVCGDTKLQEKGKGVCLCARRTQGLAWWTTSCSLSQSAFVATDYLFISLTVQTDTKLTFLPTKTMKSPIQSLQQRKFRISRWYASFLSCQEVWM